MAEKIEPNLYGLYADDDEYFKVPVFIKLLHTQSLKGFKISNGLIIIYMVNGITTTLPIGTTKENQAVLGLDIRVGKPVKIEHEEYRSLYKSGCRIYRDKYLREQFLGFREMR